MSIFPPLTVPERLLLRSLHRTRTEPLALPAPTEHTARSLHARGLLVFCEDDPRFPGITWGRLTDEGRKAAGDLDEPKAWLGRPS